ncbi:MAG: hypothetical protein LBN23_04500 [Paludibacter sp.]|jgi:hypothetical protein|nr:hypothetical protein [Paludibacter sp.]
MKRIIFIAMLAICFAAQAQDKPKIEEMHLKKWEFVSRRCKLTPEEIDSVKPIFLKYEQNSWQLMEESKNAFKALGKNKDNINEEAYAKLNDKMVNIELRKAQLFKEYYKKLKVYLSAKTIFNYFDAERAFRRELIKDWQNDSKPESRDRRNENRPEMRPPEKRPEHR